MARRGSFLILGACLAAALAGCGSSSDKASTKPQTTTATRNGIVFVSDRAGHPALYVLDPSTEKARRVIDEGGSDPSWSPDRTRIAFHRASPAGLYVVGSDGRGLEEQFVPSGLNGPEYDGILPAWSPDGRWIAYTFGDGAIGADDVKTGEYRTLACEPGTEDPWSACGLGGSTAPTWAPDSERILFWNVCCFPATLDILHLRGDAITNFDAPSTPEPHDEFAPDWSPDGKSVAVTLGNAVWRVSVRGGRAVRLANGEDPAWSPDSRQIVYVNSQGGDRELWVVRSDGSDAHPVTHNSSEDYAPDW